MFTENPVIGGINYLDEGVIDLPDTPGLGAVIYENYLKDAEKFVM